MKKRLNIFLWVAQIIVALIFIQSLFFKFTGAPEAIFIFTQIGLEPSGRIIVGIAELIVAVLLLIPRTTKYGAIGALLIIVPAIIFHFTSLGIIVQNDSGLLFGMALIVFVLSIFIGWGRCKGKKSSKKSKK